MLLLPLEGWVQEIPGREVVMYDPPAVIDDGEFARFTREEVVLIAMALEEFRDTGERELATRVNGVLSRSARDTFVLVPRITGPVDG